MFLNDRLNGPRFRDETGGDGDGAGGASNTPTVEELQAQLDSMTGERDSLNGKVGELLSETKKAKQERRDADAAANETARKKAEADGNHEQLYKSAMTENEALRTENTSMRHANETKDVSQAALKIAGELAEGENIGLLSEFIGKRLKYAEDGVKVTDDSGNLTVSSLSDLAKEIAGSARFASLIKGNKSSGGGAAGGSSGGGASKEMTRAEFNALDPVAQSKFSKDGGKLVDQ
jgi:outer membrane murein-binding lipoprotein Lpp